MEKKETDYFLNEGFGWVCKRCQEAEKSAPKMKEQSRLLKEGEAESKQPKFSITSLATWLDSEKSILSCPKCGKRETIED